MTRFITNEMSIDLTDDSIHRKLQFLRCNDDAKNTVRIDRAPLPPTIYKPRQMDEI